MRDPYTVLGVTNAASADEIRRAYRERMRAVHPDTKHGDEEAAKDVNVAYALLSDPERRRRLDFARDSEGGRHAERVGEPSRCPFCGIDLSFLDSAQHHLAEHLRERANSCQICDRLPAAQVVYRAVVGFWLFWRRSRFEARVCRHCSTGAFREFQTRTLTLGWWSYVGFFLTPYYLFKNVSQSRVTETLKPPQPNDPFIEKTLKGRPVLVRPSVIFVLVVAALLVIAAAVSEYHDSTTQPSSATTAAEPATAGTSPSINSDTRTFPSWAVDSCVAIDPDDDAVRPVACSSSLAAGTVVSIETHISECALPADFGVELQADRYACVDDWSYEFRDWWHTGACVTFDNDLVRPVDCSSGQVDGRIVAITSSLNACPANTESYLDYDDNNVICLSHSR